jgi:hypothetical protein
MWFDKNQLEDNISQYGMYHYFISRSCVFIFSVTICVAEMVANLLSVPRVCGSNLNPDRGKIISLVLGWASGSGLIKLLESSKRLNFYGRDTCLHLHLALNHHGA